MLVAGNWKMNGSLALAEQLATQLAVKWSGSERVQVAVFPPAVHLATVLDSVGSSPIAVGGQNIAAQPHGAYTGEVSADMLTDLGCDLVLVGHSERRVLFHEDNALVAAKFSIAQAAGLTPVLCVGETLREREADATKAVIERQIVAVIDQVGVAGVSAAVIAYEPVWAIGTGLTASPTEVQNVHAAIRAQLGSAGIKTRILYGGSVNADNAEALFAEADVDGGLIGGASLQAEHFLQIVQRAEYV